MPDRSPLRWHAATLAVLLLLVACSGDDSPVDVSATVQATASPAASSTADPEPEPTPESTGAESGGGDHAGPAAMSIASVDDEGFVGDPEDVAVTGCLQSVDGFDSVVLSGEDATLQLTYLPDGIATFVSAALELDGELYLSQSVDDTTHAGDLSAGGDGQSFLLAVSTGEFVEVAVEWAFDGSIPDCGSLTTLDPDPAALAGFTGGADAAEDAFAADVESTITILGETFVFTCVTAPSDQVSDPIVLVEQLPAGFYVELFVDGPRASAQISQEGEEIVGRATGAVSRGPSGELLADLVVEYDDQDPIPATITVGGATPAC